MRQAYYNSGNAQILVEVVRRGSRNTRVRFPDEQTKVVANDALTDLPEVNDKCNAKRIIPTIPLEALYRRMRCFEGTALQKFQLIQGLLGGRHGATGSEFIAELFRRSVSAAAFYANADEAFYSERQANTRSPSTFAPRLVSWMSSKDVSEDLWVLGETSYRYVDFEVFPFRTTRSCKESGVAAKYGNAGGLDALLAASNAGQVMPAIVEIKASTETVGPTFALIQALMYAAQLLTPYQFQRLRNNYSEFGELNTVLPSVEILVVLQDSNLLNESDLTYARELANGVLRECSPSIRKILFLRVSERDGSFELVNY